MLKGSINRNIIRSFHFPLSLGHLCLLSTSASFLSLLSSTQPVFWPLPLSAFSLPPISEAKFIFAYLCNFISSSWTQSISCLSSPHPSLSSTLQPYFWWLPCKVQQIIPLSEYYRSFYWVTCKQSHRIQCWSSHSSLYVRNEMKSRQSFRADHSKLCFLSWSDCSWRSLSSRFSQGRASFLVILWGCCSDIGDSKSAWLSLFCQLYRVD